MKNHQLEQLLTELTSQQAATVEGGARFTLLSVDAVNPGPENDPRVQFAGITLFSRENMTAGQTAVVNRSRVFSSKSLLRLLDMDDPAGLAGDDLLGERQISTLPTPGSSVAWANVNGYTIRYRVTAT
ncbi:hypothetical protein H6G76_21375 [Nostoc sp. FACHB-152]|uniref:hypothetical protein n=1 Tax=unclassified Nostoc TaxID=2593658 RepID=UPI001683C837|nr:MULTISPECIES: hypothetical protein [unclassified Nostoc]MBD2449672.1 hypothetical protein [Nostoc sp. FACHB-152]MBD2469664.1 hypothetical protein [Nostoc sp. FACHB-145]